nr:uncharacterized protein CFP56_38932 [Quercus suber]
MHRHLSAEWRFYHAFFRWATFHEKHFSSSWCAHQSRSSRTIPNIPHTPTRHYIRGRLPPLRAQRDGDVFADTAAKSDTELPFESLQAFDHAVRYKTAEHIVLEMAVPETRVKRFRTTFGEHFEQLLEFCEDTKVDVGRLVKVSYPQEALRSVLISGPLQHVTTVRAALKRTAEEETERRTRVQLSRRPLQMTRPNHNVEVNSFRQLSKNDDPNGPTFRMLVLEDVWKVASAKAERLCQKQQQVYSGICSIQPEQAFDHMMLGGEQRQFRHLMIKGPNALILQLRQLFRAQDRKSHKTNLAERAQQPSHPQDMSGLSSTTDSTASEGLADRLRSAVRPLTYPLVVITASSSRNFVDDRPRGVAVSSFSTVSLSPPTISFNLKLPSRSWSAMQATGEVAVHILAGTREGAAVAQAFTKPYDAPEEPFESLRKHSLVRLSTNRHDGKPFHLESISKDVEPVGTVITANILKEKCMEVADHIIVVAEVSAVAFPGVNDANHAQRSQHTGYVGVLSYGDRAYRSAARKIRNLEIAIPFASNAAGAGPRGTSKPVGTNQDTLKSHLSHVDDIAAQQRDLEHEFEEHVAALERQRLSDANDARDAEQSDFFRLLEKTPDQDEAEGLALPGEAQGLALPNETQVLGEPQPHEVEAVAREEREEGSTIQPSVPHQQDEGQQISTQASPLARTRRPTPAARDDGKWGSGPDVLRRTPG